MSLLAIALDLLPVNSLFLANRSADSEASIRLLVSRSAASPKLSKAFILDSPSLDKDGK